MIWIRVAYFHLSVETQRPIMAMPSSQLKRVLRQLLVIHAPKVPEPKPELEVFPHFSCRCCSHQLYKRLLLSLCFHMCTSAFAHHSAYMFCNYRPLIIY